MIATVILWGLDLCLIFTFRSKSLLITYFCPEMLSIEMSLVVFFFFFFFLVSQKGAVRDHGSQTCFFP